MVLKNSESGEQKEFEQFHEVGQRNLTSVKVESLSDSRETQGSRVPSEMQLEHHKFQS